MNHWIVAAFVALALSSTSVLPVALAAVTGQPASGTNVPGGEAALGTIRIPRAVRADGKPLAAGTYSVRLTVEAAKPDVPGQLPQLNRWVEFVQGQSVRGREVVNIVPGAEIAQVANGRPPSTGSSKVEMLKGNEYLRIWINRGGVHYLIHLPPA